MAGGRLGRDAPVALELAREEDLAAVGCEDGEVLERLGRVDAGLEGLGLRPAVALPPRVRIELGESTRRYRVDLGGGGPLVRVVTTNGPVSIKSR